jgi:hypothetical protein
MIITIIITMMFDVWLDIIIESSPIGLNMVEHIHAQNSN